MFRSKPILVVTLCSLSAWARADGFQVTSPDIVDGRFLAQQVFNAAGCAGGNISPRLRWSGAPAGTRSYAVTVFDPDARGGAGWWHWVVAGIPATVHALAAGSGQEGRLPFTARNDFGASAYGGPCPPAGPSHHYRIEIHALNVETLPIDAETPAAQAAARIDHATLSTATMIVLYGHQD